MGRSEVFVEEFYEIFFGHLSYFNHGFFACRGGIDDGYSGDVGHVVLLGKSFAAVNVDREEVGFVCIFAGHFVEDGGKVFAGATPCGVEVEYVRLAVVGKSLASFEFDHDIAGSFSCCRVCICGGSDFFNLCGHFGEGSYDRIVGGSFFAGIATGCHGCY